MLLAPLIAGGIGLASSLFGAKKGSDGQKRAREHLQSFRPGMQAGLNQAQQQAGGTRNAYLSAIQGFDPDAYMNRALSGDITAAHRGLAEGSAANRAGLNARGLLRSPIGNSRLMAGFQNQLAEAFANRSMQAAGLRQNQIGQMGNLYGMDQNQANMYQNALWGLGNAEANSFGGQGDAWAQALGGIGGGLMGIGGAMYGYGRR